MKTKITRLIITLACPFFLASCVTGNSSLQQVVNQHSQAIQQLQGQVSGVQPAQANNWSQVQSLRQEIAALKGDLDNLNNTTQSLGGIPELGTIITRHDRALRLIETQLALDLQLDPSNSVAAYNQGVQDDKSATADSKSKDTKPTKSSGKLSTSDMAQTLYDSGINNFNNRNYASALNSFLDFTQSYPNHQLISNAWFWQGESQYQMKNYAAAALAYQKVIHSFPNSIKAPASYLKQGMSLLALNKKQAAKERLDHLVDTYPKAPEAKRAKQVIKKNKL